MYLLTKKLVSIRYIQFCSERNRLEGLTALRVPDCNFRESLAKLEKSKLLIICLKFTFGELSSKILFECSGNL